MHAQILTFGILSALLAGVADFLAALVSRKLGSFLTLLYMIASSALLLLLAQAVWSPGSWLSWQDTAVMFGIAAAALAGYLAFYRALAIGPVAVVSPIAACDGAVAALIGALLIGEALLPGHYIAITLLVLGVALAATNLRELRQGLTSVGQGPLLAVVTMVGFGVAIAGIGYMADRYQSFLLPIVVLRLCIFMQMLAASKMGGGWVACPRLCVGMARSRGGWLVMLAAALVGLLDTGSLLALAQGMVAEQGARVSLLGPLYGAYPVVTVLLTQVFLKEKLVRNQWVGVALVVVGTAFISIIQ
jgi:drug/metabolite transporter (DMT)-like permease